MRFEKLHPKVEFLYYLALIIIVLCINNPVFSALSLVCGVIYSFVKEKSDGVNSVKLSVVLIIFVSIFNMIFSHYGEDVLFVIGDNEFTFQALFYGFNQGMILSSVITWFALFSKSLNSEKVLYIFRFAPKCALIFSMVLGFIPRFITKHRDIKDAQIALNGGEKSKKIKDRFSSGLSNFSALVSYSMESSIITAQSMEARGYKQGVVPKSRYKTTSVDIVTIVLMTCFVAVVIYEKTAGNLRFIFEPKTYFESFSVLGLICFCLFGLLPTIFELWEGIRWKISVSKI